MQRVYPCELTPQQYLEMEAHRQVRPEESCPRCGKRSTLHRHGAYERGITDGAGQVLRIWIARFLCLICRRTVSYLPSFAFSYRLVAVATFATFLEGNRSRDDVRRCESLLENYRRKMLRHVPALARVTGHAFGRAPPREVPAMNRWLEACGGLASATRQLVTQFGITLFARYQCHQRIVG